MSQNQHCIGRTPPTVTHRFGPLYVNHRADLKIVCVYPPSEEFIESDTLAVIDKELLAAFEQMAAEFPAERIGLMDWTMECKHLPRTTAYLIERWDQTSSRPVEVW